MTLAQVGETSSTHRWLCFLRSAWVPSHWLLLALLNFRFQVALAHHKGHRDALKSGQGLERKNLIPICLRQRAFFPPSFTSTTGTLTGKPNENHKHNQGLRSERLQSMKFDWWVSFWRPSPLGPMVGFGPILSPAGSLLPPRFTGFELDWDVLFNCHAGWFSLQPLWLSGGSTVPSDPLGSSGSSQPNTSCTSGTVLALDI